MRISPRRLNRATLGRQLLLQREPLDVASGVRHAVALQAQNPASPYLALWNRLSDFDPANLDAAYAGGAVVRSNPVRLTLHTVHIDDYPPLREATEPSLRASRLRDPRFTVTELTAEDADALVPRMLDFADRPRTPTEVQVWLEEQLGGTPHPGVWWALRQYAPWLRVPNGGPWSFGRRTSYVAPPVRPVLGDAGVSDASLRTLTLRYLAGFGPATVADVAQFALVQRARARQALHALVGELERLEGPNGEELFDLPGAPLPDEDTLAPPRLLGMWDNILLAYSVRDRIIPPEHRAQLIRVNGDVLPALLVDGYVAGVWRAVEGGIEATAFRPLAEDVWEGLADEVRSLLALLAGRDPLVYRRYDNWWSKLAGDETRLLDGA